MSTFFDDPKNNEFVEEWIDEWRHMVNSNLDDGLEIAEALQDPNDFLMMMIVQRTQRALHESSTPQTMAQGLNENYAAIIEWHDMVIENFEVNPDYWKGVITGTKALYLQVVNCELRRIKKNNLVMWFKGKFITAKDLK